MVLKKRYDKDTEHSNELNVPELHLLQCLAYSFCYIPIKLEAEILDKEWGLEKKCSIGVQKRKY